MLLEVAKPVPRLSPQNLGLVATCCDALSVLMVITYGRCGDAPAGVTARLTLSNWQQALRLGTTLRGHRWPVLCRSSRCLFTLGGEIAKPPSCREAVDWRVLQIWFVMDFLVVMDFENSL